MKRNSIVSLSIVLAALFIYSSCSKIDTTDLGAGLIPAVDNISTFETTLNVITDNKMFVDTTRMLYNSAHALGVIDNDPEFGKTTAAIYSSFTPTVYGSYPFLNRDSVTIDSMVLSLNYVQTYGDSTAIENFEVREINPVSSFTDSLYFLNSPDFDVRPEVLGNATVNFLQLKNDSVRYKDGKTAVSTINEMRIHLDTTFARRFVNYDTTDAYKSDSAFKLKFKGLEIRANEGMSLSKNALAYFNLDDNARTKLTIYSRVVDNGKTDTLATIFTYTNDPHAGIIRRTPAANFVANVTNGTENDEKLYIQSAPGSYATVKIPGLSTLPNSVIHRAELIADVYPTAPSVYAPPNYLYADVINEAGDSSFTVRNDFVSTNTATGYDPLTLGGLYRNNQFVLLLTRYVQSIVTKGFPNPTLRVYAPFTTQPYYILPNTNTTSSKLRVIVNTPVAAGRVIVYGGGASDVNKRMRLRIIYSKL